MRILLVNELWECGGTEVQQRREAEALARAGHEVRCLVFDPALGERRWDQDAGKDDGAGRAASYSVVNLDLRGKAANYLAYLLGSSSRRARAVGVEIESFAPDVIHVNNATSMGPMLYRLIAKLGIPAMQTVRDYGAVCPKSTCTFDDWRQCSGYARHDCAKECALSRRDRLKSAFMPARNRWRSRAFGKLFAPSAALAHACADNGMPCECLHDPFDFGFVDALGEASYLDGGGAARTRQPQTFLYFGGISQIKGVDVLLDIWGEFERRRPGVRLFLAGECADGFEELVREARRKIGGIEYLGRLPHSQVLELLREVWCVVVPSRWIENYPNTALEAIATGTLVCGSDRGGIPEMVSDERFLFDVNDRDSILSCLEGVCALDPSECQRIAIEAEARSRDGNALGKYVGRLNACFTSLLAEGAAENEKRQGRDTPSDTHREVEA